MTDVIKHEVILTAVKAVCPVEAAEVLGQFATNEPSFWDVLGQSRVNDWLPFVYHIMGGCGPIKVRVEDQKALNAVAGYFWVTPRRLG